MKATHVLISAALLAAAVALQAQQGHEHQAMPAEGAAKAHAEMTAPSTMKGEIIDVGCYVHHQARGEQHSSCAVSCAKLGMPIGFLEDGTGHIYLVVPAGHSDPREGVLSHLGKHVQVTGAVLESGGMKTLELQQVTEI
ncbi:MAG: hypothetical protein ABIL09_12850 [Gemmatimonadota bacterium]